MIKGITAYTAEIDDVEAAVGSILSQLTAQATLTPDMAGVVFCSFDFAESGVLAALEAALPFGILGITSVSQAAGTMSEQLMLSVTVYYGDGIVFKPGTSEELPDKGDISTLIADGYRAAKKDFPYQEKLIFAFAPLQPYHAGDEYVNPLSAACGHVPIFGAISTDDAPPYNNSYVIYNGKLFKNRLALLLVAGDFEPEFAVVSLPKEKAFNYKAEITEADGNILKSVNGQTMVGYFSQIGLAENGKIRPGVASMPFFLNFGDEAGYNEIPVTRAMFGFTPENYTICGGNMPIGAEIVVGTCEKADVLRLAGALSASIAKQYPGRSALFISCVGRRFALGVDMQSEANAVRDAFAGGTYMFAYGAGEVAPVVGKDGGRVNRFHNYTLIACIL